MMKKSVTRRFAQRLGVCGVATLFLFSASTPQEVSQKPSALTGNLRWDLVSQL